MAKVDNKIKGLELFLQVGNQIKIMIVNWKIIIN